MVLVGWANPNSAQLLHLLFNQWPSDSWRKMVHDTFLHGSVGGIWEWVHVMPMLVLRTWQWQGKMVGISSSCKPLTSNTIQNGQILHISTKNAGASLFTFHRSPTPNWQNNWVMHRWLLLALLPSTPMISLLTCWKPALTVGASGETLIKRCTQLVN